MRLYNLAHRSLGVNVQEDFVISFMFLQQSSLKNKKISPLSLYKKNMSRPTWNAVVACVDGKRPCSWKSCMTNCLRCSSTLRWPLSGSRLPGVLGVRGDDASRHSKSTVDPARLPEIDHTFLIIPDDQK